MASDRNSRSAAVTGAETALRSLGAGGARFHQRPLGRSTWFADWAGRISGSDVYIGITGKGPASRKVRLLLDDWIFEDVASGDLGGVLSGIFSAGATSRATSRATIKRKRSLLVIPVQVLKVSVGRSHYSAARKLPPDGELSAWERALVSEGDSPPDRT
ncbi:hypothetical protein [Streptomyces sp. NPDC051569]|uniref:hypothetical protein n=1 Tax=Streptomyces sp. NPDC051569 TaxID=3365661 RepID=UPI0037A1056B